MKRAIINTTMYDVTNGTVKENATIYWENNIIKSTDQQQEFPADVEVIDGKGTYVTPGLVDGFTHLGLKEYGIGWEGDDSYEASGTSQTQLTAIDGIYPFDRAFEIARYEGITTAHVAPGPENIISGMSSIIKTSGNAVTDMAIQEEHGLVVSLGEAPKQANASRANEPKTRMGIVSFIREQLRRVMYTGEINDYQSEIFNKVLNKEIPMYIQAHRSDDIVRAVRLKEEFNINVILVHGTEAHLVKDVLSQANIPVLAGPFFTLKMSYEKKDIHPKTTVELHEEGISLALVSPLIKSFSIEGSLAMREGLSEQNALHALTLGSASILGIADRVGSIEPGKQADLVIWNDKPLELMTAVQETIIDGETVYKKGGTRNEMY